MPDPETSSQSSVASASDSTPVLPPGPPISPRWFWNAECRAELQELRIPDAFLANRHLRVAAQDPSSTETTDPFDI